MIMSFIFDFFLEVYINVFIFDIIFEVFVFVFGIVSVLYVKKENILVYFIGLIVIVIMVYLFYKVEYFGDMMMNFYYLVMSIYGWWNWFWKKNNKIIVFILRINFREKLIGFGFFIMIMVVIYLVYKGFDYEIEIVNYIDIFILGIFFIVMWYMVIKKLENWILWIFVDIIIVLFYVYCGLGMLFL